MSGGNDFITFEQFTNYMVSITEDRTNPVQLRQSFVIVSMGKVCFLLFLADYL